MSKKIVMIGAGSVVFCKTLLADMMATDALTGSEYVLVDLIESKLKRMEDFANQMLKDNSVQGKVWATVDRKEALKDADFVVIMIDIGGTEVFGLDYNIPMKYGVNQCTAQSVCPGGVFRGLRTIPVLLEIARDMEELSKPGAIMLQYANPMAANCMALGKAANISYIGLCHGVQTTLDLIASYCAVPKEEITYTCGGINHMDWFLKIEHSEKDLYPKLREVFEKPEYYKNEKVRGEVFRQVGYFMTESTGHLSEYLPWFRKNQAALDLYCDEPGFGGESGAYYKWCKAVAEKYKDHNPLEFESTTIEERSAEYCSYIIEAVATGMPFRLMGNVRNDGYINNLPDGCCVEIPVFADDTGIHPETLGVIPPQLAAMCMSNINVQTLTVEAALNQDTEHIVHALAMDPLTSAVLTLNEIRQMCSEMLEAQRKWLPQFEGKKIELKPTINIPKDCMPAEVPIDPAQAILQRFMKLIEQKTE